MDKNRMWTRNNVKRDVMHTEIESYRVAEKTATYRFLVGVRSDMAIFPYR